MKTTATTPSKYGQPKIGCYLDQSYRNPDAHNVATIELAMGYGYAPDRETLNLIARCEHGVMSEDRGDSQILCECADEAAGWLNEQETRPFLWWGNCGDAGAFGLWPNVDGAKEDCAFVSVSEHSTARYKREMDCHPEDASRPADDFRGEWLHVSDHGNCTLYVRTDDGSQPDGYRDSEVWSVV